VSGRIACCFRTDLHFADVCSITPNIIVDVFGGFCLFEKTGLATLLLFLYLTGEVGRKCV